MPGYHTKLGHAHLKVRDLARALAFYTRFFDLQVIEEIPGHYAFLSGGPLHHELALQAVGEDAPSPPRHGVGLYHVAFEVPDRRAFAQAFKALTDAGVMVSPVNHGISWAMYFSDPDGNGLEIYRDTRHEPTGRGRWGGRAEPLDPAIILGGLEGTPE